MLCIPYLTNDPYYLHVLIMIGICCLLSSSLNVLVGYTGQLSIGHAAFFGIGAYTSALLSIAFNFTFLISMLFSGITAGFFGICLGLPTLRLRGSYLVITTIGFAEIVRYVLMNWKSLTRGPLGLFGIPPAEISIPFIFKYEFLTKTSYYYLTYSIVFVCIGIIWRIIDSNIGKSFIAIRENETLADSLGINCTKYKVYAFTLGAFFAGIAGSLYSHYILFISPETFNIAESAVILAMVLVGGAGTKIGPIIGSAILVILPEILRGVSQYRFFIFGVVLLFSVIFMSTGIMGIIKKYFIEKKSVFSRISAGEKERHYGTFKCK